jgi:hypothetical protein
MRFSVVGSDPETGLHLELVVDAPSLEDAAAIARRRQVHVMAVTPAEAQQPPAASSPRRRGFRTTSTAASERPGRGLRATANVLLVGALFTAISYPLATLAVSGALLGAIATFVVAPKSRGALRRVLGVWSDRPVHGAAKLAALVLYGAFLVTFGLTAHESLERERAKQAQQRAQDAAAALRTGQLATEVRSLLGEARGALQDGDIAKGEELTRKAVAVKMAPNRDDAVALLSKIESATDPARTLVLLTSMPAREFTMFSESGQLTASLDSGFEVLNARQLDRARAQLAAATEKRAKLAEEEEARREEARKNREAQAQRQHARAASGPRTLQENVEFYKALLEANNATIVEGVTAQQIGDNTWEATLTVADVWHIKHKQIRLQDAQTLWETWAMIASPQDQDRARIKIVDHRGNEVGGSRVWGGSLIWVNE